MTIGLKKKIITTIKFALIALFILSLPDTFQVIWNCGKDFGSNVMRAVLSLI